MKPIKRLLHVIHVNWVLAQYALNGAVLVLKVFLPSRIKKYINPRHWFRKNLTFYETPPLSLSDFKPFFIRISKVFKTHKDILPEKAFKTDDPGSHIKTLWNELN